MAKQRMSSEINAGSMADIAFLLLIFFLVTTTIAEDKGLLVKLPPYSEEPPENVKLNKRNVYSVLVNSQDQLLVRDQPMNIKDLKNNAIKFILNPEKSDSMSDDPKNAIISIKNDRGTSYGTFLEVYNELKAAYNQIWEEEAQKRFRKDYNSLTKSQVDQIKEDIPLIISEAEPTKFGEEN